MQLRIAALLFPVFLFLSAPEAVAIGEGNAMVSLSSGIVTYDDFRGVTATSYMDIPYAYSTAFFASYRYFMTDRIALGVSVGLDDVKGNLTEGNPNFNGGQEGTVGTYIRHAYTIAPELFIKYHERGMTMLYGCVGIGYTFSKVEKAYDPQIYAAAYQNGVNPNGSYIAPYLSAQNPVYVPDSHMNFQVTALGIRVGGKVAWNLEIGAGYKGVINTGVSLKL